MLTDVLDLRKHVHERRVAWESSVYCAAAAGACAGPVERGGTLGRGPAHQGALLLNTRQIEVVRNIAPYVFKTPSAVRFTIHDSPVDYLYQRRYYVQV
jgi:hypothetical protein